MEKEFGLKVNIDEVQGVVEFTGEELGVIAAVIKFKDVNMAYMSEQEHSEIPSTSVEWQYEVSDGNFTDFSHEQAGIIENAFLDYCPVVYVITEEDTTFKIVFKEHRAYCVSGEQGQAKRIRRCALLEGFIMFSSCFLTIFC